MYCLLCAYSCNLELNADKLQEYGLKTATLYIKNHNGFYMPQAIYKMLIHGHQVVRKKPIAIGLLSEEAQESRNKDVKNFRENFTRKFSRKQTNEDLMNRLLASSDPYITSMRRSFHEKSYAELPEDTKELLMR